MKKDKILTALLIAVFVVGLFLILFPFLSNLGNSLSSSQLVAEYAENVSSIDDNYCEELFLQADEYNKRLAARAGNFILPDDIRAEYESLLNVGGDGVMGYIEIPSIGVTLPIYHGTDEKILSHAVGHMEWTSLPIGGRSTHSVLSGHSGLVDAELFTNLEQLETNDIFYLRILNKTLAYEVDNISVVLPSEVNELFIEDNRDYCTLMTCTPYGINSHRLLVRGHRVENDENAADVSFISDATIVEQTTVAYTLAVPALFIAALVLLIIFRETIQKGLSINDKKKDKNKDTGSC